MQADRREQARRIIQSESYPWLHIHDLDAAWWWLTVALAAAPSALDLRVLATLCENALDACAPALLIGAHAAGYPLERVMAERLARAYERRYGRGTRRYLPARLAVTARGLFRPSAT
jgi:hypothetical protein